jgi:hypothetical protein
MTAANDVAVRRAFEAAGVEFIDENGVPAVRLPSLAKQKVSEMNAVRRTSGQIKSVDLAHGKLSRRAARSIEANIADPARRFIPDGFHFGVKETADRGVRSVQYTGVNPCRRAS